LLTKLRSELRSPSPAFVLAALALFVALGGSSYAAVKLKKNSVLSSHIKNEQVQSADVKDASLLAQDFGPGQLPKGDTGDRGSQGERGEPGEQGEPGTARAWALVDNTCTSEGDCFVVRAKNFTAARRIDTGRYCVKLAAGTGVDPATDIALTAVEWNHSAGPSEGDLSAMFSAFSGCDADEIGVRTESHGDSEGNATHAVDSNDVAFVVAVP
jgi:hypothetical protein